MLLYSFFIGAHVSATTTATTTIATKPTIATTTIATTATWLHFVYAALWQIAMHLNKRKHLEN